MQHASYLSQPLTSYRSPHLSGMYGNVRGISQYQPRMNVGMSYR
tara:strand:- start:318 stop:449 length:132 start_codon:yes stop_codon:yes gene_type:complete